MAFSPPHLTPYSLNQAPLAEGSRHSSQVGPRAAINIFARQFGNRNNKNIIAALKLKRVVFPKGKPDSKRGK